MPSNGSDDIASDGDAETPGKGPGRGPATSTQIALSVGLIFATTLLLLYLMFALWPRPTPAMVVANGATAPQAAGPSSGDTTKRGVDTTKHAAADTTKRAAADTTKHPADTTAKARADTAKGARLGTTTHDNTTRGTALLDSRSPNDTTPFPADLDCDSVKQREWRYTHRGEPPDKWYVDPSCVQVFGWNHPISNEQRLLLLVMIAGALGAMLHVLRSIGWYVGTRKLVRSWLPRYFLLPLVGATIALIMYVVIRGGFFASSAPVKDTSPFGFLAVAAVMGLFTEQAILKLKELSETMLAEPKEGPDPSPQHTAPAAPPQGAAQTQAPTAGGPAAPAPPAAPAAPATRPPAAWQDDATIAITGQGFTNATTVAVNGVPKPAAAVHVVDPQHLTVTVAPNEAQRAEIVNLAVRNADGSGFETQITP